MEVSPLPGKAVQVGPGTVNLAGATVGSSTTFTVAGTAPNTVTVYVAQGTGFTAAVTPIGGATVPETNGQASVALTEARVADVNIIFLGGPAIGKDGIDYNKNIDDVTNLDQCIVDGDTRERIVGENADCTATGVAPEGVTWAALSPNPDMTESRSKVVARTGLSTAVTNTATPVIDGKTKTHELMTGERNVTVYALLEDGAGKPLVGQDVNFSVMTMPAGIIPASKLTSDESTKSVIADSGATLTSSQILVDGLELGDSPTTGAIIAINDAVARYELESLPTTPFNITIVVTAGNVTVGTIEIVRTGPPTKVVAGVFNIECFDMGAEDDYSLATFNADNDGCDSSGMSNRFGHGEKIVVKAHHEDNLDLVVGSGSDLSSKLSNDDDDLIGNADIVTINMPVTGKMMPRAWVYTVDKDATLGEHMITVSTSATDKDGEAIDDVMLTVTVAGPPANLAISGDANIPLGDSVTYTVIATDMLGGIPHLTTEGDDRNDKVSVSVQPTDALIDGDDSDGQVTLGADGTAEFIVWASLDAEDGDAGRIIVRLDDLRQILPITFGETAEMPSDELMPPMGIDVSKLLNTISVVWTPNTAQNATLIKVVLFNEDSTAIVAIKSYNPAASDPGAHDFENVAPGTYEVVVAAYRPGEPHALSDSHTVTIR